MPKEFEVNFGTSEIAPGWVIHVRPIDSFTRATPGSTAYHEGLHTVAALLSGSWVIEASRIPGPGYLGITHLSEFNAVAFMAAHAFGCDGTGHNVSVVSAMGHDPESAAWAARSVLSGHEDEIQAVSALIETRGAISGYEALWAMQRAASPQVEVEIMGPVGEKRHFIAKIKRGENSLYLTPPQIYSNTLESIVCGETPSPPRLDLKNL